MKEQNEELERESVLIDEELTAQPIEYEIAGQGDSAEKGPALAAVIGNDQTEDREIPEENRAKKKKPWWLKLLIALAIILIVGVIAVVVTVGYLTRNMTMDRTSHDDVDLGIGTAVEWNESMEESSMILEEESSNSAEVSEPEKKEYGKHRVPSGIKRRDQSSEESSEESEEEESEEESKEESEAPNLDDVSFVPVQTVSREGVINIALFGLSAESAFDALRSDSIIILTLDTNHWMIKLTSILRDSKVPIEGYRAQKINAAYRYGGPWLAIKTINQNFGLDVRNYVTVDLGQMAQIINAMGGVYLHITPEEAAAIGTASGDIWLNGSKAVAYCRLRNVGTDTERARRQRNVLNYIFYRFKDMSVNEKLGFAQDFLQYVATSLSWGEIVDLLSLPIASYGMATNSVPIQGVDYGVWGGIDSYGEWVWVFDIPSAARRIQNFIYG